MTKISQSPYGMSETYTVKFWYTNAEGWYKQGEEDFYCNSKSKHKQVEAYAMSKLGALYSQVKIISVTYN